GHDLDGVGAVGLEDPHGSWSGHAVAVEEEHDLPHDLFVCPRAGDALCAHRADSSDFAKPGGLGLGDVEDLFTKGLDHLLRVDWPDTADHPGTEVLLDAVDRRRLGCPHEARLELLAVRAVIYPVTGGSDPLAGGDGGGMANDGHQVSVAAGLD